MRGWERCFDVAATPQEITRTKKLDSSGLLLMADAVVQILY